MNMFVQLLNWRAETGIMMLQVPFKFTILEFIIIRIINKFNKFTKAIPFRSFH